MSALPTEITQPTKAPALKTVASNYPQWGRVKKLLLVSDQPQDTRLHFLMEVEHAFRSRKITELVQGYATGLGDRLREGHLAPTAQFFINASTMGGRVPGVRLRAAFEVPKFTYAELLACDRNVESVTLVCLGGDGSSPRNLLRGVVAGKSLPPNSALGAGLLGAVRGLAIQLGFTQLQLAITKADREAEPVIEVYDVQAFSLMNLTAALGNLRLQLQYHILKDFKELRSQPFELDLAVDVLV